MVKNKHGGNRHKKMASKNAKPQTFNRRVRFAKSEQEIYAKVEKVYGGNRALVICNDGRERLMEWARKFGGRNKRDNFIGEGCIVLVGKREWQLMDMKKKEKVDLLEVYQASEIDVLKKKNVCNELFGKEEGKAVTEENIEFTHEGAKEEYSWAKVEDDSANVTAKDKTENVKLKLDDGEEIDWDEI